MFSRILVPVDGSAPSKRGLRQAIDLAAVHHATLVAVNVVSELPLLMGSAAFVNYGELSEILQRTGRELVDQAAADAQKAGVACETVVVDGGVSPVSDAIVDQIARQRCDVVVMGTHGRRGLTRLTLGSDAELVVRHAAVPVLLVRAPEGSA